jgi:hypothetical protein
MLAALATSAIRCVTGGDEQSRLEAALADVQQLRDTLKAIQSEIVSRKFSLLRKCSANMPPFSLAAGVTGADPDEAWNRFTRENPNWRETLKAACAIKLAMAQKDHGAANERVRGELADMELRETEILNHPRLRRATASLNLWRGLTAQCDTGKDAYGVWVCVTKNLSLNNG